MLDEAYRDEISRADIYMANQEFPFSDRGTPAPDKQFTFRVPPERVSMMHELGIDIVTIANNHTLDYGTDALVDTCTTLENAGIPYVGAGANMDRAKQLETIEVRGRTIGFLAASRVYPDTSWVANSKKPGMVSGYDPSILLKEIEAAGEYCDYLVVYMHWGIERDEKPQEYQRTLGRQLIDAGADLVIGSHPHVLQGIEYYQGKADCIQSWQFYLWKQHSEDRAFARRCGSGTESGEFIPGPRHFRGRIYKGTDRSGKKGRVLSVHAGDFVRCDHR